MARVVIGGVGLAVHEWPGASPARTALVAIHGLTANHACWQSVADGLAGARRLIAYDLRGRGDSDKPPTGYGLAAHGQDVLGLLDHFGLPRAVLIGHSLGAAIALGVAVTAPARVARLVLVDGGLDVRPEVLDSLAPALARLGQVFPSRAAFLERLRGLPMFAAGWNDYLERYFTYDVETLPGGAVRAKAAPHAIAEELARLARERLWVWHHQVRCPTLLLRAPEGLLTATDCLMTADEAAAIAAAIPDCRLVTVPGANHYTVLLARQPAVTRALHEFLEAA